MGVEGGLKIDYKVIDNRYTHTLTHIHQQRCVTSRLIESRRKPFYHCSEERDQARENRQKKISSKGVLTTSLGSFDRKAVPSEC